MTPREELAALRRLAELEAKASGGAASAAPAAPERPEVPNARQTSIDEIGGILGIGGSIGATLLAPYDIARSLAAGELPLTRNRQRRQDVMDGLRSLGADTESIEFKRSKIGTEIAGTLGAGPAIAAGLTRAAPSIAARAAPLLDAIRTAGFSAGGVQGARGVALRSAGGATTGGAAAGLVNPEDAGTGAAVGGALPGTLQLLGKGSSAVGRAFRGSDARAGERLANILETDPATAAAQLRRAQTLVPGSEPTVSQVLRTPQASIAEGVVSMSPGGAALKQRTLDQNAARMAALDGVAPVSPLGLSQTRADLGESIARQMIPEEARIAGQIRSMHEAVDPYGGGRVNVPVRDFDAAVGRYLGRGSFGQGSKAEAALDEARTIASQRGPDVEKVTRTRTPQGIWRENRTTAPGGMIEAPAKFSEVRKLRASINDAWNEAKSFGRKQEAAALDDMRKALDAAIDGSGGGLTPEMQSAFREANRSFANHMDRFHTGPQAGMFGGGAGGAPRREGGEIVQGFWGNRPGLAEDVDAFRRLVDDQPGLLDQFRSMVATEGASTADAGGALTSKFVRWTENALPGLRKVFNEGEVKTLQRIAQDIKRSEAAAAAGKTRNSATYQNAANALNLGLLDSPFLNAAANRVPVVNSVSGPALQWMRESARERQARGLAQLFADPAQAARVLDAAAVVPDSEFARMLASPEFRASVLRTAPVLQADR
jgi:hypothetical protein